MYKILPYDIYKDIRRRRFSFCMRRKGYGFDYINEVLDDIELFGNAFCTFRSNYDVRECLRYVNTYVQKNYEKILRERGIDEWDLQRFFKKSWGVKVKIL